MSTFIDGVGQCQVLDKSGELVDLKGHDITSLDKTGVFNWEHLANSPATLVGKILKAKKIFSEADCENERHLYWWKKCKTPYLYVMGELLDDYTSSAKECAGQMRYSRDNPQLAPLLGFSIEGSEIPNTRKGMIITRSIARKCTLTASPCNSMCLAEIFESDEKPQIKDDFDEIFKSEAKAIELLKSDIGLKIYGDYMEKKEAEGPSQGGKAPKSPNQEYDNQGIRAGKTKAGETVYSHGHVGPYSYNPAEHKTQAEHHRHASTHSVNPKLNENKQGRAALHSNAVDSGGRADNRAALSLVDKDKIAQEQGKQQMAKKEKSGKHICKAEAPAWSAGKVNGGSVHYSHPEHGTVSIQKQPHGFDVKHNGALAGIGGVKGSFKTAGEAGKHAKNYMGAVSSGKFSPQKMQNRPSPQMPVIHKAITAGSTNAAPSTLVNGAAYQTESLGSREAKTGAEDHKFQATKKKDWNARAKQDYDQWPHKEKFEKFMKARMPHLADGEIRAIGRTIALKKSIDLEKSLSSLVLNKTENKKIQEHVPVHHDEFHQHLTNARNSNPQVKEFTHLYKPHEFSKMKTFLHPDKKSGFAVKPDGDIVSLFSTEKGRGDQLVQHAKKVGGNKLDAFEGYLTNSLYPKHGFKETKREKNWTPGKPDVVYMGLNSKSASKPK